MAKVKGVVIINTREFAFASGGEGAWNNVLARLTADDRDGMAAVIPVGWYDIGLYDHVNRALAETLGGRPEDVMEACGRFAAERDLRTIHRLFLRMANPAYVIERSAGYWGRFQDSGSWDVVREPPSRVVATLRNWGSTDELTCIRLGAYMFRLFQLVGAKNGSLQRTACRARGDAACVFDSHWD